MRTENVLGEIRNSLYHLVLIPVRFKYLTNAKYIWNEGRHWLTIKYGCYTPLFLSEKALHLSVCFQTFCSGLLSLIQTLLHSFTHLAKSHHCLQLATSVESSGMPFLRTLDIPATAFFLLQCCLFTFSHNHILCVLLAKQISGYSL